MPRANQVVQIIPNMPAYSSPPEFKISWKGKIRVSLSYPSPPFSFTFCHDLAMRLAWRREIGNVLNYDCILNTHSSAFKYSP